jgi:hypothetical protein
MEFIYSTFAPVTHKKKKNNNSFKVPKKSLLLVSNQNEYLFAFKLKISSFVINQPPRFATTIGNIVSINQAAVSFLTFSL